MLIQPSYFFLPNSVRCLDWHEALRVLLLEPAVLLTTHRTTEPNIKTQLMK